MSFSVKGVALSALAACFLIVASQPLWPQTPAEKQASLFWRIPLPRVMFPREAPPAPKPSLSKLVQQHTNKHPHDAAGECLASAIYFETRGEPLEGQLAVAEVVINRTQHRAFRKTICGVVREPHQFSFVRDGHIPVPDRSTKAWAKAVAVAHIARRGLWESRASEALYFHARRVTPGWRRSMIHQATLGNHVFYRPRGEGKRGT